MATEAVSEPTHTVHDTLLTLPKSSPADQTRRWSFSSRKHLPFINKSSELINLGMGYVVRSEIPRLVYAPPFERVREAEVLIFGKNPRRPSLTSSSLTTTRAAPPVISWATPFRASFVASMQPGDHPHPELIGPGANLVEILVLKRLPRSDRRLTRPPAATTHTSPWSPRCSAPAQDNRDDRGVPRRRPSGRSCAARYGMPLPWRLTRRLAVLDRHLVGQGQVEPGAAGPGPAGRRAAVAVGPGAGGGGPSAQGRAAAGRSRAGSGRGGWRRATWRWSRAARDLGHLLGRGGREVGQLDDDRVGQDPPR